MQAVILANGEFPSQKWLLEILKNAEFLAVCDGAIGNLEKLNRSADVIIGDLDSITQEKKQKYAHCLIHIQEQESNDLCKAFFHCVGLGYTEFVILGATGKREDHTLANIFLLQRFARHCKKVEILSDFGKFGLYRTPFCIPTKKGEQISLFALDSTAPLSSQGLKYPLKDLCLQSLFSGSLNEAEAQSFSLTSPKEVEVIVYQAFRD